MPSIGHAIVGASAGALLPEGHRLRGSGVLAGLALLPDLDVVGMAFGVPYGATWGHRGAMHSLVFAVLAGSGLTLLAPRFAGTRLRTLLLTCSVIASHGLLDALTDGGLGVALLWPFTSRRFFAPWRPIPVAPIGLGIMGSRGMRTMCIELAMFAPLAGLAWILARRKTEQSMSAGGKS